MLMPAITKAARPFVFAQAAQPAATMEMMAGGLRCRSVYWAEDSPCQCDTPAIR